MVATIPSGDAGSDLRTRLAGFLDEFYRDGDGVRQRERVEEEPQRTGDTKLDAYLGAIAEHLCRRWILGEPPRWVERRWRFLQTPWFMDGERMKPILLKESPGAFRRRLIFTEAEPLRRASMPRDGRWWHYEALRSGMRPAIDDVVQGRRASIAGLPDLRVTRSRAGDLA